ncbi:MAG: ATP phosphoribosyltransferase regulatory subunit [Thioalkalivibrionaceae bacterium]
MNKGRRMASDVLESQRSVNERWRLPVGLEEMLPDDAARLESLRRAVLDRFAKSGYALVVPPLAEFLDSLLIGAGEALDLQTFRLTDQLSGRSLGLRADITPQVARIDAHRLCREPVDAVRIRRLCYAGHVLRCRADEWSGARNPLQVGAELFGVDHVEADLEVLQLMVETLQLAGLVDYAIDLGHVGVFRALSEVASLDPASSAALFDAMQRKSRPDIAMMLDGPLASLDPSLKVWMTALPGLHGGVEVLADAETLLESQPLDAATDEVIRAALTRLRDVSRGLDAQAVSLRLHFDLAELRGYSYHTGLVFAAFVPGSGQAIARGGRYDGIGAAYGHARPATGFSTDLMTLLRGRSAGDLRANEPVVVFSPQSCSPDFRSALNAEVSRLRAQGRTVIADLGPELDLPHGTHVQRLVARESSDGFAVRWVLESVSD